MYEKNSEKHIMSLVDHAFVGGFCAWLLGFAAAFIFGSENLATAAAGSTMGFAGTFIGTMLGALLLGFFTGIAGIVIGMIAYAVRRYQ